MKGSITLQQRFNANTSTFMTVGHYDTFEEQERAMQDFIRVLTEGGNSVISCTTYKRPDGYNATYITFAK